MFPVFLRHFAFHAETHQSRAILFLDLTLAFHLQRRMASRIFGLCGMYKFMLSCNSPGVGRVDPHIMAHILTGVYDVVYLGGGRV